MKHYIKAKEPIYADSNEIMVEIEYMTGKGYAVRATPCSHTAISFSIVFDRLYSTVYTAISKIIFPCTRKSKKTKALAENWLTLEQARAYALEYCNKVQERGGQLIELCD